MEKNICNIYHHILHNANVRKLTGRPRKCSRLKETKDPRQPSTSGSKTRPWTGSGLDLDWKEAALPEGTEPTEDTGAQSEGQSLVPDCVREHPTLGKQKPLCSKPKGHCQTPWRPASQQHSRLSLSP